MTATGTSHSRRILFVDHAAVLGGGELSLLDMAVAFRERCAVALFEDGPFAAELAAAGVAVIPLSAPAALKSAKKDSRFPGPTALMSAGTTALALARAAASFDVLYANSPKSFLVGAVAGLVARRPIVWHLRDILDRRHFSASNTRMLVLMANARALRVVANSRATADAFIAAGGRPSLVRVVHNGIDAAPFDRLGPGTRSETRRALGIDQGAFVVGSFSRLHPWKGQRVLFEALASVPGVHAIVAGGALFSGESDYEGELRGLASSAPLSGRVHLLGARRDIPQLMMACDVIAHTSVWPEPFGRVLVEAALAGRPLIASDAGGVREIVTDGQTALLTPPGDAAALACAMRLLRDDRARGEALASAGAAVARQRFTREAMLAGVTAVLDESCMGLVP